MEATVLYAMKIGKTEPLGSIYTTKAYTSKDAALMRMGLYKAYPDLDYFKRVTEVTINGIPVAIPTGTAKVGAKGAIYVERINKVSGKMYKRYFKSTKS